MNFKRILVLVLTLAMAISACAPAIYAFEGIIDTEEHVHGSKGDKHYVSIGDSMANGYGFEGYAQGTAAHDFLNGVGTYGEGSYALQFENYLKSLGYNVEHTKLAASALRAEDLLYILGGRDEAADDWFDQVLHYTGCTYEELAAHYQNAVKDADVITLGIGNASFGAFMLDRVTSAVGVMGAAPDVDPEYTLENALDLLEDEEQKAKVLEIYETLYAKLCAYVPDSMEEQYNFEAVCDVVAYTAAGFILNYAKSVDKIVELNEKENLEIVLVGLMNTTYGMEISLGNGKTIPFGTLMDEVFGLLNAYVAAYPTLKQMQGELEGATFYYADEKQPLFIVDSLDDLANAGWENIDGGRLSADIIRSRTISTYNGTLRSLIGAAFAQGINAVIPSMKSMVEEQVLAGFRAELSQNELVVAYGIDVYAMSDAEFIGFMQSLNADYGVYDLYVATVEENYNALFIADPYSFLPEITLDDVKAYVGGDWTNQAFFLDETDKKTLSVAVYLAIEDAIVESVDVDVIPADGIAAIAGDLTSLFADFAPDTSSPDAVRETLGAFMSSETMLPLVKIYAIFKIGDGMCVHSTPSGHDAVYSAIVKSYEEGWTAQKQTILNAYNYTVKYYDEAYELAYAVVDSKGYTSKVIAGIDKVLARLDKVDLSDNTMTDAFRADLQKELDALVPTLNEIKGIIATDKAEDVPGLLESLRGLKDDVKTHIKNIYALCKQAGYDVTKLVIIPMLEELVANLEEYVEILVDKIIEHVKPLLKGIYGDLKDLVEIIIKVNLLLGGALDDIIAIIEKLVDVFGYTVKVLVSVFGSLENALIIAGKIVVLVIDYLRGAPELVNKIKSFFINIYDIIVSIYGETHSVKLTAKAVYNYVVSVAKYIRDKFNEAINGASEGDYELTIDSYYVALGNAPYARELAKMLYMSNKEYKKLGLDDDYLDVVAKADLVTVKFNNNEFYTNVLNHMINYVPELLMNDDEFLAIYDSYTEEVTAGFAAKGIDLTAPVTGPDWSKYLDEETRAILSQRVDAIIANLEANGLPTTYAINVGPTLTDIIALPGFNINLVIDVDVAALLAVALEAVAYESFETSNRVVTTLDNIYSVAPNATVVITGIVNPLEAFTSLITNRYPALEQYLELLDEAVELLNLPLYSCAVAYPNAIFVPSDDAQDIYDALNVHHEHYYNNPCVGTVCEICGEVRNEVPGHQYGEWVEVLAPTTEAEGLKEHTCEVCGHVESAPIDKIVDGGNTEPGPGEPEPDPVPEPVVEEGLSTAAIVGIAVGSIALACGVGALVYWFFVKKKVVAAAASAASAVKPDKKD